MHSFVPYKWSGSFSLFRSFIMYYINFCQKYYCINKLSLMSIVHNNKEVEVEDLFCTLSNMPASINP